MLYITYIIYIYLKQLLPIRIIRKIIKNKLKKEMAIQYNRLGCIILLYNFFLRRILDR